MIFLAIIFVWVGIRYKGLYCHFVCVSVDIHSLYNRSLDYIALEACPLSFYQWKGEEMKYSTTILSNGYQSALYEVLKLYNRAFYFSF